MHIFGVINTPQTPHCNNSIFIYKYLNTGPKDAGVFIAHPAWPILHALKVQSICLHTPCLRSRVARLQPGHVLPPKTQVSSARGIAKPHVACRPLMVPTSFRPPGLPARIGIESADPAFRPPGKHCC